MKELNTALGIFSSKFTKRPFYLRFHVTHRCNYRCRMCNQRQSEDPIAELSLEQIRTDGEIRGRFGGPACGDYGRRTVSATRPSWSDRRLQRLQFFGAGTDQRRPASDCRDPIGMRSCRIAGPERIGGHAESSGSGRNLPGEKCRRQCFRTLTIAREVLPHSISQANIVASRFNFEEIPALVKYFHDMGSYSYVTPVMILTDGNQRPDRYKFRSEDRDFRPETLPSDVHKRILDSLIALRKRGEGLTNSTRYLRDYRDYLATGRIAWRCEAGTLCLDILPDGSVSICKEKPSSGKHSRSRFQEVFPKPRLREARQGADRFLHRMFLWRIPGTAVRGPGPVGPCRMGA